MMKRYYIWIAVLMTLSLLGCSKTSVDPEAASGSTVTVATVPQLEEPNAPPCEEVTDAVLEIKPVLTPSKKSDYVRVADYIPSVVIDLKYATPDNFTGKSVYAFHDAYLRHGTVQKLIQVSDELAARGLSVKIWDAFRPYSAQLALWESCPDENYVSNPQTGSNSHCRGRTVDITLVDAQGRELEMPSGYDDFTALADRDYSDCSAIAAENALVLQEVMEKYGFMGYQKEWWHYSDTDEYPVDKVFDPAFIRPWYADCNEFISLREEPSTAAPVMTRIPANDEMILLGWDGDFALVNYQGEQGYVLGRYINGNPRVELPREILRVVLEFEGVPCLTVTSPEQIEKIRELFATAEVLDYEPKTHSTGAGLNLVLTGAGGESVAIDLDIENDIARMDGKFISYGAPDEPCYIEKLWDYLGVSGWPEALYEKEPNCYRGEAVSGY